MIKVRSPQDLGAGLLFIAIGAAGLYFGRDYAYGSAAQMGPGYFPTWLSGMIVAFGIAIGARSLRVDGPSLERFYWRPNVMIWVSLLAFGLLVERIGLALTGMLVTIVAGYASRASRFRELLPLAVVLGVSSALIFVYLLDQPMPPWWGNN